MGSKQGGGASREGTGDVSYPIPQLPYSEQNWRRRLRLTEEGGLTWSLRGTKERTEELQIQSHSQSWTHGTEIFGVAVLQNRIGVEWFAEKNG